MSVFRDRVDVPRRVFERETPINLMTYFKQRTTPDNGITVTCYGLEVACMVFELK